MLNSMFKQLNKSFKLCALNVFYSNLLGILVYRKHFWHVFFFNDIPQLDSKLMLQPLSCIKWRWIDVTDGLQQIPFACTIIVMPVKQVSDVKVAVSSTFTYSCLHYWYDPIALFWNMEVQHIFDNSSVIKWRIVSRKNL